MLIDSPASRQSPGLKAGRGLKLAAPGLAAKLVDNRPASRPGAD